MRIWDLMEACVKLITCNLPDSLYEALQARMEAEKAACDHAPRIEPFLVDGLWSRFAGTGRSIGSSNINGLEVLRVRNEITQFRAGQYQSGGFNPPGWSD
jgi:hypothetical protein